MKIIIAAGGSGGHLYPALALAEHLKKNIDCRIYLVKSNREIENKIVKNNGYVDEVINLDMIGLSRKLSLKNAVTFYKLFKALIRSKKLLRKIKPDVVIGMGGYVSFPIIYSAKKYRTIIHEQNVIPGLVNKMLSKNVNDILISFEESRKYFDKKCILIKNPRVLNLMPISSYSNRILIVGGSQGSELINDAIIKQYDKLKDKEITFITGDKHYKDVVSKISDTTTFKIISYLDNFTDELKKAKLIVCRSGATTISEIIELLIPSVLIPSTYVSNNHQMLNAKVLTDNKAAIFLIEDELANLHEVINIDQIKLEEIKGNLLEIKNKEYTDVLSVIKGR
ncbi:UDP-N-acetylglucosamine--N-acetylmuramyl-(pentapeptide) pyrophosphoryl-undecaprenol N-acetylglucosamine transferase [Mycoplasmatota bacterium WC44]